jgi:hypothetical protein
MVRSIVSLNVPILPRSIGDSSSRPNSGADLDDHGQPARTVLFDVVVGGVVVDVAVQQPLARLARQPDDVKALVVASREYSAVQATAGAIFMG